MRNDDESVLGVDYDIPRCFDLPDATKVKLDGDRKTPGVELSIGVWRRPDAAIAGRRPGVRFER